MSSPRPFAGVGEIYSEARRGYPLELVQHLEFRGLLHAGACVLDIGSGTGQLALLTCEVATTVVALEPEPDMVDVGKRSTADHANVEWQLGRDADVRRLFGRGEPFDLVTIGNAFHHMDRSRLLDDLDAVVTDSGCVAICSSGVPAWLQSADWSVALRSVFAMTADRSGVPDHDADIVLLSNSAFSTVERWTFERLERRGVDSIVGELLTSASGLIDPERAQRLHDVLAPFAPNGAVLEQVSATALIATRPTHTSSQDLDRDDACGR